MRIANVTNTAHSTLQNNQPDFGMELNMADNVIGIFSKWKNVKTWEPIVKQIKDLRANNGDDIFVNCSLNNEGKIILSAGSNGIDVNRIFSPAAKKSESANLNNFFKTLNSIKKQIDKLKTKQDERKQNQEVLANYLKSMFASE